MRVFRPSSLWYDEMMPTFVTSPDYDHHCVPYRIELDRVNIAVRLLADKRRLEWSDLPPFGVAVTLRDDPSVVLLRNKHNNIICLDSRQNKLHDRIVSDVSQSNIHVWNNNYTMYCVKEAIAATIITSPYDIKRLADYQSSSSVEVYDPTCLSQTDRWKHVRFQSIGYWVYIMSDVSDRSYLAPRRMIHVHAEITRRAYLKCLERIFLLTCIAPDLPLDVRLSHIVPHLYTRL